MRVIDLFCGAGGLTSGFINAGFKVLLGIDNWEPAIKTYLINHDHNAIKMDLSNVEKAADYINRYDFSILIGGAPCQDFSSAGSREEGDKANLSLNFAQIIDATNPRFFVKENVSTYPSSNTYLEATKLLSKRYNLTTITLNAAYCGVPQSRKRHFIIGERDTDNTEKLLNYFSTHQSKSPMTVRDYMPDIDTEFYYRHPRSFARRAIFSIDEPSPTIRGTDRPIAPNYKFHKKDAIQNMQKVRTLTLFERAKIQTFDDSYNWGDTNKTILNQMIGNAVPPNLAKFVAEGMINCIGISALGRV